MYKSFIQKKKKPPWTLVFRKKKKNTLSIYVETVNLFLSEGWHWLYLKNWLPFSMSSKDSTTLTEQDLLINQKKKSVSNKECLKK